MHLSMVFVILLFTNALRLQKFKYIPFVMNLIMLHLIPVIVTEIGKKNHA
jgi:hypothetical protein